MKAIIAWLLILIASQECKGWYDPFTGLMYYTDEWSRLHEQGHALDHRLGDVSKTDEFIKAVDVFRQVQYSLSKDHRHAMADKIMFFPGIGSPRLKVTQIYSDAFWQGGWGGFGELYADIWAKANGDIEQIPVSLQPYFRAESED